MLNRIVILEHVEASACAAALDQDEESMIFEKVDVPTRQIGLVINLLVEHFSQKLIRLLLFVVDEALGELVHEVGSHAHDFSLIHLLFHVSEVDLSVVLDVALNILVLCLDLDVVGGLSWGRPIRIRMLLLSELVALLDLGLLEEDSTKHLVTVEERLHLLSLDCEKAFLQRRLDAAVCAN